MSRLKRFFQEIHQRSLWQVLLVYLGASYAILEAVDLFIDRVGLPDWFFPLAAILLLIGLPAAVATALASGAPGVGVGDEEASPETATEETEAVEATDAPVSGETPRVRRLNWRTAISAGVVAIAAWGAVATGWLLFGDREQETGQLADGASPRVVVLPFTFRGSDEFAYLGEGMVDLLSTKLDGAGDLTVVDPRAVLGLLEREGGGAPDPERGQEIAERLGARFYVLGNILEVGGQLQLDAAIYETGGRLETLAEATSETTTDRFFSLVDQVAGQLLLEWSGESGARIVRIAAVTTDSLRALKEYLQGEQAMRSGQFLLASEAFSRAVEIDTAFALAWYRLSVAWEWQTRNDLVREAAEQAFRHSGRLSEHDRQFLEAMVAARQGDATRAELLYRAIVGTHPDDVEAWFQLGEVLFHYGPLYGRPIATSREAFERVLFYEPDDLNSLTHLIRIALREGRLEETDSLARRFLALEPAADRVVEVRAQHAFALGSEEERQQVILELEGAPDRSLLVSVWSIPLFVNLDGGERVARILTQPSRSHEIRALGHLYLAHIAAVRGRWAQAQAEFAAAAANDPPRAIELKALVSTLPFVPASTSELRALLTEVRDLDPDAIAPSAHPSSFLSVHNDYHAHIRAYLLGVLSARLEEYAAVERYATELEAMSSPAEAASFSQDLAYGLRAHAARRRGDSREALRWLERAGMLRWYQLPINSPFFSQSYERFLRASLLDELGRYEEALRWYGSFEEISVYDLVFVAPSHLRRAEIYETLGERERAAFHYERFIELWSDADPELRTMVDDAAARLAAVTEEPTR
jgi:tetratricopeptide (TPR) repeat protein